MVRLNPLSSFWKVYEFWFNQEKEAIVAPVSEPEEYFNDLVWTRTQAFVTTSTRGEVVEKYFRVLNNKEFTRPQELKSANDFYQGRLDGISCLVTFNQIVTLLNMNIPKDKKFDEVREYLRQTLTKGSMREFPKLARTLHLARIAEVDDYLVGRASSLQRQLELF